MKRDLFALTDVIEVKRKLVGDNCKLILKRAKLGEYYYV